MAARREATPTVPSDGQSVATKLRRIAEKARKEPSFKFTSLYHLMNEELLRECYRRLRKDAAAGIDDMTKAAYAKNLDANLSNLFLTSLRTFYDWREPRLCDVLYGMTINRAIEGMIVQKGS